MPARTSAPASGPALHRPADTRPPPQQMRAPTQIVISLERSLSRERRDRVTIIESRPTVVMKRLIPVAVAVAGICAALRANVSVNDPASQVVRVRARVTTPARRADLSLRSGTVVSARSTVTSGTASGTFDPQSCHVENASAREIEIDCQCLVANLPEDGLADWKVSLEPASSGRPPSRLGRTG